MFTIMTSFSMKADRTEKKVRLKSMKNTMVQRKRMTWEPNNDLRLFEEFQTTILVAMMQLGLSC